MINYNLTKEEVLNLINKKNTEIENAIDISEKKSTGSYYTNLELSSYMMEEMFNSFSKKYISNIDKKTFLEPCLGIGSFVFAYLLNIYKLKLSKEKIQKVINNIYVCDINPIAVNTYKELLTQFVYTYFDIELPQDYFDKRVATCLLYRMDVEHFEYIDIKNVFSEVMEHGGFDIIATNPPYKNLKAEKNKYTSMLEYEKDKQLYEMVSKSSTKVFNYSSDGIINLYRLFVEDIICKYSSKDAIISLLVPNTILSDKTCQKLRTYILKRTKVEAINIIKENNSFVNAQQALCTLLIHKDSETSKIRINNNFCDNKNKIVLVDIKDLLNESTGNAIFTLNEKEYKLLEKINSFPKIKDIDFIVNLRGELDLTLNKEYFTNTDGIKLIRGKNIGYFELKDLSDECVKYDFLENSNKKEYVFQDRIACQQIANIHKQRRVSYAFVPKNYVLGNSCNFISVLKNEYDIDLYYMLGLLNSDIINWYFKLTSSNNHINNYEIDNFPIPLESTEKKEISKLVKKYMNSKDNNLLIDINRLISNSFEIENKHIEKHTSIGTICGKFYNDIKYLIPQITIEDAENIVNSKNTIETYITSNHIILSKFQLNVVNTITEKYVKIQNNEVLNHITFKLSDLDLEMIRNVPQGGNWQDIPQETVQKSKRLSKITKTGGRTTLYGRIDYNKPSYTITTYFNRPGNGTYVHPNIDRVLSVREASRLQSFNDDYYFYGNKTELLKQVGNAVPPLLAKAIGERIVDKTGCTRSIDLFCGAGGMTSGFKSAGINAVLGNDFNESACVTYKANNPEIEVLNGDITKDDVKQQIIEFGKSNDVDIVCGGPPCQGFSYAGKRFIDDPRNQLFKHFVEVVRNIHPKIVVMENVEGILTFDNGNVYKQIHELYQQLGYNVEGKVLLASNYGVPQKRKRVIIIGVRQDLNVFPAELFPIPTTINEEEQVTAFEAISDLEKIDCNENAKYIENKISDYIDNLRNAYKNLKHIIAPKKLEQLSLFN